MQRNKFFYDKSKSSESESDSDHDEYDSQLESSGSELEETWSSDEEDDEEISEWIPYSNEWNLLNMDSDNQPQSKINKKLIDYSEPIHYFSLFLDEDLLEEICRLTELYYKRNTETKQNSSQKKKRKWETPDIPTLKCFFGVLLSMGILKKPSYREYWTTSRLFETPGISELMTSYQFERIKNNLHFVDEETCDKEDVLYKIRPLIEHFISISQSLYVPQKELTIDETMIKFNGRSRLVVYMPLKPIKYGFKAYALTESSSGYVLNWILHEGKKNTLVNIVRSLTNLYEGKGYIISMDRFYTTLDVVKNLLDQNFHVFAAITQTRARLTVEMKDLAKKLKRGEALFYCSNDRKLLLTIWKDSKVVYLVSNRGDDSMGTTERRCKSPTPNSNQIEKNIITRPNNMRQYSLYARGVDYMDQRISYYLPEIRSRKWYMPLMLHWLEIILHNSFIIYSKSKNKPLTFLEYRKIIIKALIFEMREQKQISPSKKKVSFGLKKPQPIIIEAPIQECKLAYNKKSKCKVCSAFSRLKYTNYYCKTHEVPVCILECYDLHRQNLHI